MASTKSRPRIFPRWMVALAAMFALGWLLYLLRGALTPVFFAFLIAYMLDPVIDRFEARGYSRAVGIAVMLTIVLGGLGLFFALALPGAIRDLVSFVRELPMLARGLLANLEPWLSSMGVAVPHSFGEALQEFELDAGELARQAALPLGTVAKTLLGGTMSFLGALAGLLLVPVFAAYLLYDFDRITAGIGALVPGRYRTLVVDIARDVDGILGEFIRGQLIVMLILAVLYSLTYSLLGVRLAVLIGVVAGLLSFIPYVGGGVALGLGVAMSLIYWSGWGQLVGVLVAYTIIQVFEGFVITPRVVGDKVGLSAVWVLFALLVGGEVFGFMGVLLALPAAAVIKIFVVRGLDWYRASTLFLGEDEPDAEDDAETDVRPVQPEPPPDDDGPAPDASAEFQAAFDDPELDAKTAPDIQIPSMEALARVPRTPASPAAESPTADIGLVPAHMGSDGDDPDSDETTVPDHPVLGASTEAPSASDDEPPSATAVADPAAVDDDTVP